MTPAENSNALCLSPEPPEAWQQSESPDLATVHAAMTEAVAGGAGPARLAEITAAAVGGPVAIVIPELTVVIAHPPAGAAPGDPAVAPADLVRWVSERERGRPTGVPAAVVAEAPIHFGGTLRGVVALLRSQRRRHPAPVQFLQLAAGTAVTEVAVQSARAETEQSLRGTFLEELRARPELEAAEIVRRAARLRCDLSAGAVALCAQSRAGRPGLVTATIAAEHPGALVEQVGCSERVYALLPAAGVQPDRAAALASARRLAERLERQAIVGLSALQDDPADLGSALEEAELMVDVLCRCGAEIGDELGGGIYRLLFRMLVSHPDELRSFHETTIGPLVRNDERHGTDLTQTLQAYIDSNCNMNATAAAIYAHRHTVAYRLGRVRELTELDPMLCEHRERLGLGLKVHRLISRR